MKKDSYLFILNLGIAILGLIFSFKALALSGPLAPVGPKLYFGSGYNNSRPIHFEPQYLYPNSSKVQVAYDDPVDDWSYKFFQVHFIPLDQEVGLGIIQTVNNYWPYIDNLALNKSYQWEVRACAYRGNGNCNSNCQSTDGANSVCQWTNWSSPPYNVYTPPQIPSNLRATNISQHSVTLSWSGTPGSTVYNVKIWKGHLATRTNRECGADTAPAPDFYLQNVSSGLTVNGLLADTEYTWSVQSGHNNYYYKPSSGWGNFTSWNCLLRPENTAYFTTGSAPTRYACNTNTWQCYQSSSGPYSSLADCQINCQAPVRYACNTTTWQCYQSSTGQYSSLTNCQANCQAPVRYTCNTTSWQCYQSSTGPYTSLADCQTNCQAPPTRYNCNTNTWQCYASLWGQYSSLADCQANCQAPVRYTCNTTTWQCYQSSSGQYSSLTDCQANCQAPPTRYNCNTNTWQCYASLWGQYSSLTDCQANCQPSRPPTVDLSVYPATIYTGQSSLLSWYSNYATSCYASGGWSGTKSLSGSETVTPNQTTTYTITCYGAGGSATDTVTVVVLSQYLTNSTLDITKLGRNLTAGQNYYAMSVNVKTDEVIEFWIRVANTGNTTALNVVVKDSLPLGLKYYPNSTKVDGQSWADGLTTTGLSLGNLSSGAVRIITFQAIQESTTSYTSAYNLATVEASNASSNSSRCLINHQAVLGAATVATGPRETLLLSLVLSALMTLVAWYYFSRHPQGRLLLERFKDWKTELALKRLSKRMN